jgi:hypothetical protein
MYTIASVADTHLDLILSNTSLINFLRTCLHMHSLV